MILPKELHDLYSIPMIAKFMATIDKAGNTNLAFIASIDTWEETSDFIIFGEFLMWKSLENLKGDKRVGTMAMTADLAFGAVNGDFNNDFTNTGPIFDKISYNEMFRYNSYTKIRQAGTIAVKEHVTPRQIGKLAIVSDMFQAKGKRKKLEGADGVNIPLTVKRKFDLMQAVKAVSFMADGKEYPTIVPVMSIFPIDGKSLVFKASGYNEELKGLKNGQHVAVMVLTMEPIAYQVKGRVDSFDGSYGKIVIEEAFSSSPPLAGEKIA